MSLPTILRIQEGEDDMDSARSMNSAQGKTAETDNESSAAWMTPVMINSIAFLCARVWRSHLVSCFGWDRISAW